MKFSDTDKEWRRGEGARRKSYHGPNVTGGAMVVLVLVLVVILALLIVCVARAAALSPLFRPARPSMRAAIMPATRR
jgi:hypothetical protein